MQYLDGRDLLGRPAKIKPCVPKKNRDGNLMTPSGFVFDRWERDDASDHFKGYSEAGRRLRVSGLPKPGTQVFMNEKIRGFFKDFSIEAISKTISPHYSGRSARNHPHYLYVDFASSQEAEAALSALDGVVGPWGTVLRLSKAKGDSQKFNE
ncbi:hypothetical protein EYZ11_011596 [Aspergillus tanneri]|uniref:RRM domain-containing protein n=1 Tax=Aspergillus tanneri TaxID=1220188 RepID=A0A4S3J2G1_9EURO|nr:uncharacterized protein ATNIH1004_001543 [Aspergillus tanneri]KAA8652638.1 hypothetical protein ATNIH1004_001543 [Aspergillus tanneri]THC88956.1 hypothetical protein EYZ11_011596 [Aspergillus tanneri]